MIAFLFSLLLSFNQPILATEASTSANSSEVQQIREVVQQKVKEKLNLIKSPSNKAKSLFGTIEKINDNEININWKDDSNTIITDDETTIVGLKRNKLDLEDLKPNQEILAMGYFNAQNKLETKRIVLIEMEKIENKNQVVNGKIVDVSQNSPVFTVVPQNNKNNQYQIETNTKTISKIAAGQKIIAVIKADPKKTNTFDLLKIIKTTDASTSATPTPKD